jgi:tRNA threonylcarbamoyladenosine biosynthesis protein TsaE
MRLQLTTRSEAQTGALGEAIGALLIPGDLLALHGELGAGKTRLVRGVARGAGADERAVSSPTFVVMQEYAVAPDRALRTLVHADAYRLRGTDELETIGWDRIAGALRARRDLAVVIEWAERIESALARLRGASRLDVRIEHAGTDERRIVIEGDAGWASRGGWTRVQGLAEPARPHTRCPVTGKPVPPDSPTYPFFDERARMADLGRWMSGSYRLTRPLEPGEGEPGAQDP